MSEKEEKMVKGRTTIGLICTIILIGGGILHLALGVGITTLGITQLPPKRLLIGESNWQIAVIEKEKATGHVEITIEELEELPTPVRAIILRLSGEENPRMTIRIHLEYTEAEQLETFLENTGTYDKR